MNSNDLDHFFTFSSNTISLNLENTNQNDGEISITFTWIDWRIIQYLNKNLTQDRITVLCLDVCARCYEVPLTTKIEWVHPWVQVDACANFEEITWRYSWDIQQWMLPVRRHKEYSPLINRWRRSVFLCWPRGQCGKKAKAPAIDSVDWN